MSLRTVKPNWERWWWRWCCIFRYWLFDVSDDM